MKKINQIGSSDLKEQHPALQSDERQIYFLVVADHACASKLGVSIFDPTRHDPKINGSGMSLIFLVQIGSDRVRVNSTRPD
jgi:hypothetical protein